MSHGSKHLHVYKSDLPGLSLPSAPRLWWRSRKAVWAWFVNVVFKLSSSLECWGLSPFPFQSEWVWSLHCCIKYGRSDSVPVFWAKVLRDCSLDFLRIGTLALGEASLRVRSPTTLRLPCGVGRKFKILVWRGCVERGMPTSDLSKMPGMWGENFGWFQLQVGSKSPYNHER